MEVIGVKTVHACNKHFNWYIIWTSSHSYQSPLQKLRTLPFNPREKFPSPPPTQHWNIKYVNFKTSSHYRLHHHDTSIKSKTLNSFVVFRSWNRTTCNPKWTKLNWSYQGHTHHGMYTRIKTKAKEHSIWLMNVVSGIWPNSTRNN